MKKSCELCKSLARIYCDSDQASLCWDCDAKVHSANFLVARHSRSLLCHVCQSPTPWNASGEKLGPTVSVCERCIDGSDDREESEGGNDDEIDTNDDYDGDDEIDLEDEDGDNQVVPWSSMTSPPAASSSSSEETSCRFSIGDRDVSSKRMRVEVADPCSDDDLDCSSSQRNHRTLSPAAAAKSTGGGDAAFVDSLPSRPLKSRRIEANEFTRVQHSQAGSRSEAIVEALTRFHQHEMTPGNSVSAPVVGVCKATRSVDLDSSESS